MRALLLAALLAALAAPGLAQGRCGLLCDEELVLEGAEAQARLEGWLGAPLPEGSVVAHLAEGGFQDVFVRARIEVDEAGLAAVLAATGIGPQSLSPEEAAVEAPSDDPAWWDWKLRPEVVVAEGSLPLLPHVTLRVSPSPEPAGGWTLYLWAFQT